MSHDEWISPNRSISVNSFGWTTSRSPWVYGLVVAWNNCGPAHEGSTSALQQVSFG